jgi:protein-disulfide isomerase
MKKHYKIVLALFVLLVGHAHTVFSQSSSPLPWALLPRVAALDESRKNELIDFLKAEPNYGNCKNTMFQCLVAKNPDKTAVRFANFGAYLVSRGVPSPSLGFLATERSKLIYEGTAQAFTFKDTPFLGNEKAKITIVEFAEFKCPYCVTLGPVLKKLVNESNGQMRFYFKHFPLKNHPGSFFSSKVAVAAHRQGKSWEMYDLLFKDLNKQGMEDVLGYAQALGLDMERFKKDREDPAIEELIERDKMEGVRAMVMGTPTLFINGKMYNLRNDEDFLKDSINEVAEHIRIAPPYKDWVYGGK